VVWESKVFTIYIEVSTDSLIEVIPTTDFISKSLRVDCTKDVVINKSNKSTCWYCKKVSDIFVVGICLIEDIQMVESSYFFKFNLCIRIFFLNSLGSFLIMIHPFFFNLNGNLS